MSQFINREAQEMSMGTSDKFCLRWDSRWETFAKIQDYNQFFDCTLTTDDEEAYSVNLRAHKVILSTCSEFFGNILTKESMCAHPNPVIYISGISTLDMQNILHFIYNGEVSMDRKEVDHFLEVADNLKIKGLIKGPIGTLVETPEKGKINSDVTLSPSHTETKNEESFKIERGSSEPLGVDDLVSNNINVTFYDEDGKAMIKEGKAEVDIVPEEDENVELNKNHSEPPALGALIAEHFQALKSSSSILKPEHILNESSINCEAKDCTKDDISNDLVDVDEQKYQVKLKCLTCWNNFSGDKELNQHIIKSHGGMAFCSVHNRTEPLAESCPKVQLDEVNTMDADNDKEEGVLVEGKSEQTCNISSSSRSPEHETILVGDKFHCDQCPYSSYQRRDLKTHIERTHEKIRYECKECGYVPSRKYYLKLHMQAVHLKEKIYQCELCPYKASRKDSLKTHVDGKHEKIGSYVCEKCGFVASKNSKLKHHRVSVHKTGDNVFICEQCPYASAFKASLKIHVDAVHNKMLNHVCDECGHATARKSGLITHMETKHKLGDKQYKCEKCPVTKFSKVAIMRHTREVHELTKDFICEDCGFAAKHRSLLKRHMDSVHEMGDKSFTCDDCDYAGYQKVHLKQHRDKHCKGKKDKLKREHV